MHARGDEGALIRRRRLPYLVVGGLAALGLLGLYGARRRAEDALDELDRRLRVPRTPAFFHEDDVAALPAPARRYLLHAIAPGTPLASHARLESVGRIRLGPGRPWLRFRATETLAPPHGYVWRAAVGSGPSRRIAHEALGDGWGTVGWWRWGLLPVCRAEGPAVHRSAAGRLALAAIWMPSALLPSAGARWTGLDDDTAEVVLTIGGFDHRLTLRVDSEGRLVRAHVLRWREDDEGGRFEPFGFDRVLEEGVFGGYRVPTRVVAGWETPSARAFRFVEPRITRISYG